MDWLLTNGTVIDVLSIGEEALDEERLLYVRRRVASAVKIMCSMYLMISLVSALPAIPTIVLES